MSARGSDLSEDSTVSVSTGVRVGGVESAPPLGRLCFLHSFIHQRGDAISSCDIFICDSPPVKFLWPQEMSPTSVVPEQWSNECWNHWYWGKSIAFRLATQAEFECVPGTPCSQCVASVPSSVDCGGETHATPRVQARPLFPAAAVTKHISVAAWC